MKAILEHLLLEWCQKHYPMDADSYSIVKWQIGVFLETLLKIIILIFLGYIFKRESETLIFIFCFCGLRYLIGGFHFKSNILCTLSASVIWLTALLIDHYCSFSLLGCFFTFGTIIALIAIFAPCNGSIHKVNGSGAKKRLKRSGTLFTGILFLLTLTPQLSHLRVLVLTSLLLEALTIIHTKGGVHKCVKTHL